MSDALAFGLTHAIFDPPGANIGLGLEGHVLYTAARTKLIMIASKRGLLVIMLLMWESISKSELLSILVVFFWGRERALPDAGPSHADAHILSILLFLL